MSSQFGVAAPETPNRSSGTAYFELLAAGAVALLLMGLLAFGYNLRKEDLQTVGGGQPTIQNQTPSKQDMVSPLDRRGPETSSSAGQGSSNGEQVVPPR